MTSRYKKLYILFTTISILITISPMAYYVIDAFISGDIGEKFTLGCCATIAVLLTLLNIVWKKSYRSTLWVLILGIYVCIDNILPLLLFIAIGTIVDEFIFNPLSKKYKQLMIINKEIDKRG